MDKYERIHIKKYTAEQLLKHIKSGGVLLEIRIDEEEKTVSVCSYAEGSEKLLFKYAPLHFLNSNKGEVEVKGENNLSEWRELFSSEETWIDIYDEDYWDVGRINDVEVYQKLLNRLTNCSKDMKIEMFLSRDRENFDGPLEIEFLTTWLKDNPKYYIGNI